MAPVRLGAIRPGQEIRLPENGMPGVPAHLAVQGSSMSRRISRILSGYIRCPASAMSRSDVFPGRGLAGQDALSSSHPATVSTSASSRSSKK